MTRFLSILAGLVLLAFAAFWYVTEPSAMAADALNGMNGDPHRGEAIFWAGGCASCHAAAGAKGADQLKLGGGPGLVSGFGTFYPPNISPDPVHGIGSWTLLQFATALQRGIGPKGRHLYPAFPYSSYNKMTLRDVADLWAYLRTLPPVATPSHKQEVGFPFSVRRFIGVWNLLYESRSWVIQGVLTPEEERGRYLVEAVAHCGQCHTPRTVLGGMKRGQWLAGAPNPDGKGRIPNITPAALKWSKVDIVAYLRTGLTPEYDSAGGHMADVVQNIAHLPKSDAEAIAAYLKKVPPVK